MHKRGRTRMLLVLLLPWQAFGNIRNRSIGPLVSVIRTVLAAALYHGGDAGVFLDVSSVFAASSIRTK
jgi:hypothetical protein